MRGEGKKKRVKSEKTRIVPDEDDLELIAENTGAQIKKKRKLRKNIDEDESQKSDAERREIDYSSSRQKLTERDYNQRSPYQDEEYIDTNTNQR